MATPWRHRHHAISLPALLLVAPLLMAAQPAATISLTANPASVSYQGTATLNWSATDANTCRAGGAWSGKKAAAGSEAVGPLTATSTFSLKCHGRGKPITQSVTVTVEASPPLPLPSVSLIADPTTVDLNGASTLSWSSSDATSCDAGGAWSGSKPLAGNQGVGPLVETSTFTLTCTGAGGSTNRPVTVSVLTAPEPPTAPCSASLFSPDLAGQFRSIPATMGALEVAGVACQ